MKVVKGVTRRITQAEYDKKRAKWRQQQKLHERKLARLSQVDEQYYVTVAYLLEIATRGSELFKLAEPNEKRELIGLLGQNLLLDGKNVQITLNKPFDTLASCLDSSIWLTTIEEVITVIEKDLCLRTSNFNNLANN